MAHLAKLTSPDAIRQAIAEADELGRQPFLDRYKFGKALKYFLHFDGKRYDSKAIVAVAYGKQYPDEGPLQSHSFSGGEGEVARVLRKLGFTVRTPGDDRSPLGKV